jgi:uncharacterized NAD-dependent epimerase/dehydratase family protein
MLTAQHRIAVLLHGGIQGTHGKTGLALLRYTTSSIVAVIDEDCTGQSLSALTQIPCHAPIVDSVKAALVYQPDVLVIGIAPAGGTLPSEWVHELQTAAAAGLSIANGLHSHLAHHPDLEPLLRPGQWIWDIRQEPTVLKIGSAQARNLSCLRVLTVGTDMAIGKMSASLELHQAALRAGLRSKFLGTGQAGLLIGGDGVALDAIRVDFAAGAVEQLVMQFGCDHEMLFIEGQGSIIHPGSTATLPLLRGSQPTHLILVHRAGQTHIRNHPQVEIPPLSRVIELYELLGAAAGAFAPVKVVAIALNTSHLDDAQSQSAIANVIAETGLPCTDPVRWGADSLLTSIEAQT